MGLQGRLVLFAALRLCVSFFRENYFMKRVIVGGISHETSTFTPVTTTLESYRERFLLRGQAMLQALRGTNTPIGGFIDGAARHGFELIPTLFAEAHTSAPTPRPIFDGLVNELLA